MRSMPDGLVLRPPTMEDADAVLEVVIARDVADLGHPDYSLDDVRADWTAPGVDLSRDAWVVEDAGRIVATANLAGDNAFVYVHPDACGRGIGTELRELVEARAAQRGTTVLRQFVAGANDGARVLLTAAGYWAAQHYWRMRIELVDGATGRPVELPPSTWPGADLRARPFVAGEDDEATWRLVRDCFAEVEGMTPQSLAEWRAARITKDGADFATWQLVEDAAGDLVGAIVAERFGDGLGYVDQLAVAPSQRGRGLGRALLLSTFRRFRELGDTRAELSVHTKNTAGARLYESVGMSPCSRAERWEKTLIPDDTTPGAS